MVNGFLNKIYSSDTFVRIISSHKDSFSLRLLIAECCYSVVWFVLLLFATCCVGNLFLQCFILDTGTFMKYLKWSTVYMYVCVCVMCVHVSFWLYIALAVLGFLYFDIFIDVDIVDIFSHFGPKCE